MSIERMSHFDSSSPSGLLTQMARFNAGRRPVVTFPLPFYPTHTEWHHGKYDQRQFGARREVDQKTNLYKRIHAGVDLEAPIGTPVLAMADGVVLRADSFYMETDVVEVLHPGVGIIRYGEVAPGSIIRSVDAIVRQGQKLAAVGQRVENNVPNPRAMLHLELFSDVTRTTELLPRQKNALTQGPAGTLQHPEFERRDDLTDPTRLLESAKLYKGTLEMWPEKWPAFTNLGREAVMGAMLRPLDARTLLLGAPMFRGGTQ